MIDSARLLDPGFMEAALTCFSTYDLEKVTFHHISNFTVVPPTILTAEFGDKTQLFAAVLSWYIDNSFDSMLRQLRRTQSPVGAILYFFQVVSERSVTTGGSGARLVFTTAIALAPRSSAFEHIVSNALQKVEAFFCECVAEAQEMNEGMTREPAEHLAKLLLGSVVALPILAHAADRHATVDQLIESVKCLLAKKLS